MQKSRLCFKIQVQQGLNKTLKCGGCQQDGHIVPTGWTHSNNPEKVRNENGTTFQQQWNLTIGEIQLKSLKAMKKRSPSNNRPSHKVVSAQMKEASSKGWMAIGPLLRSPILFLLSFSLNLTRIRSSFPYYPVNSLKVAHFYVTTPNPHSLALITRPIIY